MMIDMTNSPRTIPAKCLGFYLQGRDDGLKIRVKEVAARIVAATATNTEPHPCIRELVHRECSEVADEIGRSARRRRQWAAVHASEITAAGVSDVVAFDTYLMGCTDEAALMIEGKVVDAAFNAYDDDDADEPDTDEDDDEDTDDEEDDDED